jgi:hypothetical protein
MGIPKSKKKMDIKHSRDQSPAKRKKQKLIQLDDLIPKQNVAGGSQLLFGVTSMTETARRKSKR